MLSHIGKLNHFYATALSFYFARYATAERAATFPSPAAFTYWYGAPVISPHAKSPLRSEERRVGKECLA